MISDLVSVIIPVFNSEHFLAETIESTLAQSYRTIEVIVVDDGSTDGSAKVAQGYPVRCYFQQHLGPGAARNFGIRQARGEFLSFLDADDVWMPEKTTRQMEMLARRPELEAVFGWVEQFSSAEAASPKTRFDGTVMNGLHPGAMLIRSASFARIGMFATGWQVGEFMDWYGRAMDAGLTSAVLPEVVVKRRIHDKNLTRGERMDKTEYARILKTALDRRRSTEESKDS
jgi:glycosyltransferase involved in cell wall biosynthesis